MNQESILKQFELVESSVDRAKIPFETGLMHKNVLEVTLYELIKAREQILNMIREIDPIRFGPQQVTRLPEPNVHELHLCPYCGSADCQSDHK